MLGVDGRLTKTPRKNIMRRPSQVIFSVRSFLKFIPETFHPWILASIAPLPVLFIIYYYYYIRFRWSTSRWLSKRLAEHCCASFLRLLCHCHAHNSYLPIPTLLLLGFRSLQLLYGPVSSPKTQPPTTNPSTTPALTNRMGIYHKDTFKQDQKWPQDNGKVSKRSETPRNGKWFLIQSNPIVYGCGNWDLQVAGFVAPFHQKEFNSL